MKKIFYWLLKKYSETETDRIEIQKILDQQVKKNYREQTPYGNVYNGFSEFIMANEFINQRIKIDDVEGLEMIKKGINCEFDETLEFRLLYKNLNNN